MTAENGGRLRRLLRRWKVNRAHKQCVEMFCRHDGKPHEREWLPADPWGDTLVCVRNPCRTYWRYEADR